MLAVAVWYVILQGAAAAGLAIAARLCRGLPDRGYCAAKMLGVLSIGVALWLGTACGLVRNSPGGALLAALGVVALALAWSSRGGALASLREFLRRNRSLVVAAEALFLAAFLGWCWVRAHDPAIDHTEEPMDLMLLTAVTTSESFPPRDPWLAGYPISYYYLGYWLLATLGQLAGTSPEVTYNLGQAAWLGFLLLGSFGLAWNLGMLSLAPSARRSAAATGCGLLAAGAVGLLANWSLPLEWLSRRSAGTSQALWSENWWWWRASRVVRDRAIDGGEPIEAITEFPFFSYLLGDNHPHVLAMPVVLVLLTLALAVFAGRDDESRVEEQGPRQEPRSGWGIAAAPSGVGRLAPGGRAGALLIVVAAGSVAAINTWDVPAVWSILIAAVTFAAARRSPRGWRAMPWAALAAAAAIVAGALVVYLPYHLTASSQVRGVLPNLLHPTPLGQVAVMFAPLLPGALLLVAIAWDRETASVRRAVACWLALVGLGWAWLLVAGGALAGGWLWTEWAAESLGAANLERLPSLVLGRWANGWPTLVAVAGALAFTVEALWARLTRERPSSSRGREDDGLSFALLLAAAGLLVLLLPELAYLHDSFGTRMNTVFKFWYQGWMLLAVAAALGITLAWRRGGRGRAAGALAIAAMLPGLLYPVTALWTKTGGFAGEPTLDGLAWLERWRPDELAAIRWLRGSTAPEDVVVQRSGASYRAEHNLPSMATGRATLLGWGGHELQWRGEAFGRFAAGREEALAGIYAPASPDALAAVLEQWSVDYVYLGPEERARYEVSADREAALAAAMDLVFENAAVRIYRRRG